MKQEQEFWNRTGTLIRRGRKEPEEARLALLTEEEIPAMEALQKSSTDPALYFPLSREEFAESIWEDHAAGVFAGGRLAGFFVLIENRNTPRSLAEEIGASFEETATFDAVVIDPQYRGNGLQRKMLELACDYLRTFRPEVNYLAATVSPDNSWSRKNFLGSGFTVIQEKEKYNGSLRLIVSRSL